MKCHQCNSEATQVGNFWVCPEHGPVSPEKPFAPLRIFLSYGHDANEELVRRIKNDLEKHGHDVWFDKTDIRPGDDWRGSITDGITKCDRFFSFLSKHSTRDPGVCLDEILIAIGAKGGNIQTVLVEGEQEVKPPRSVSHVHWVDMHDWKTGHGAVRVRATKDEPPEPAAGDAAWEKWYQERFAEIIRVVESDESRRFAEEIKTLERYLKPTTSDLVSDARIRGLLRKELVGRKWLFEAVENWRNNAEHASRLFWIMGAPGVGKSAFAAHLAHSYGRATVIGVHFCAYDKPDHRNALSIIRTLAFQIATRLPDYRKFLLTRPKIVELDQMQTAAELFGYLLADPLNLCITGGRERYLIVIDALDEAGEAGRNPLVEMLARHAQLLPDWIGIVITSRPESEVIASLKGLDGLNPRVLDTATESNRDDLREYLRHELAPQLQNRPDADRLVEQILEKSEGVFLYVERFCDDVHHGHLSLDHPDQFPQGLGGIFCQYFQRQFPDLEKFRKDVRPALRAILAAREPLPVEILQSLFNWQDEELRDFTHLLGSLFPVMKEFANEVIKPYHKSLADWLADEVKSGKYFVSVKEGHRNLAEACWKAFRLDPMFMQPYTAAHIIPHLAESERWDDTMAVLRNDLYVCARVTAGQSSALTNHFVNLAGKRPGAVPKDALANLVSHLIRTQQWDEIEETLLNLCYLEARVIVGQLISLVTDFATVVTAMPQERPRYRMLSVLEEALRRDLSFIESHAADYPQALFQCLWNSCWWYDCPYSGGSSPPAPPGPKLFLLLENWRSNRHLRNLNAPWLRALRPPAVALGFGGYQNRLTHPTDSLTDSTNHASRMDFDTKPSEELAQRHEQIEPSEASIPFRCSTHDTETVIERVSDTTPLAFFPARFDRISQRRNGSVWEGKIGNYHQAIMLEGQT